jgi:hypothetical protein
MPKRPAIIIQLWVTCVLTKTDGKNYAQKKEMAQETLT